MRIALFSKGFSDDSSVGEAEENASEPYSNFGLISMIKSLRRDTRSAPQFLLVKYWSRLRVLMHDFFNNVMCSFQFKLELKVTPRYLQESTAEIALPYKPRLLASFRQFRLRHTCRATIFSVEKTKPVLLDHLAIALMAVCILLEEGFLLPGAR